MTGEGAKAVRRLRHVLCIIGAGPQAAAESPLAVGADDGFPAACGIYAIAHRDIAAVVRDAPAPGSQPTRQDLIEHLRLLERIMESSTVIPVEFGTIVGGDDEVTQAILAARYDEWQALLARLAGKIELGIKALWKDMQTIFAEVVAESEAIRALRDRAAARVVGPGFPSTDSGQALPAPTSGAPGPVRRLRKARPATQAEAYQERIELGRMVAEALGEKKDQEAAEILEALAPLAVETHCDKLLGDSMILNAAFLVERQREAEFDDAVSRLARQRGERMVFRYVGPAPPFNFVGAQRSD